MFQDVMIAGFGGQGILLVGKLLAHAGMMEGKQVTWFPSYGAEIRGRTANCTVIIADREIGSPLVQNPAAMLIMNEASYKKFEPRIHPSGDLFLNTSLVHLPPDRRDINRIEVPANLIAEELGDIRIANMVMLGAFLRKTGVATLGSILDALKAILPFHRQGLLSLNEKALRCGGDVCAT
jgi:2-oxoglutarate ferredoxin oxidoreductase subunit gamma